MSFWEDCWTTETSLAEAFPVLLRLSSFKENNIFDFVERTEEPGGSALN